MVGAELAKEAARELVREAARRTFTFDDQKDIPSSFIREVLCYNQGKILEFWYYMSEYCDVNDFVNDVFESLYSQSGKACEAEEIEITIDDEVAEILEDKLEELSMLKRKLLSLLWEVYRRNKRYILEYFRIRGKLYGRIGEKLYGNEETSPRVVIKVFVDKDNAKIDYLLKDFFPGDTLSGPFHVRENTAIEEVFINQGYRALINDIPNFYKQRKKKYKNPRLYTDRILAYSPSLYEKIKIGYYRRFKKEVLYVDGDWKDCWKDRDRAADSSFYKSTMVIPITLINNEIGEKFKEFLEIHTPPSEQELVRAIYGFLCFDSIYTDFFDNTDENMGYFFADIFSFYLVPFQMKGVDLAKFMINNKYSL